MASVASGWFFISRWCLVVVRYPTEEGEELFSARKYRVNEKMKAVVKRACFGFSLYFQSRKLVFGPLWLCIFGVFRLRVWQQSGQGMCLKVVSRYTRGLGVWGKEPKEEKGPWSPTKLCLFPLPLWKAQPAPSLQNQNSDSWPFSPLLWHSGTTPTKNIVEIQNNYYF